MAALGIQVKEGYAYEAPILDFIAEAEEKNWFKRLGGVPAELRLITEGMPPAYAAALKRKGVSDDVIESLRVVMKKELDKASDRELSSRLSPFLLGEYNKKNSYGLTEEEFNLTRDIITDYLNEHRANVLSGLRHRLPAAAQARINKKLEKYAKPRGDFEDEAFAYLGDTPDKRAGEDIDRADGSGTTVKFGEAKVEDKQFYIQENWRYVMASLLKAQYKRIDKRLDISDTERAQEKTKIMDRLEKEGPETVIKKYIERERARKGGLMFFTVSSE